MALGCRGARAGSDLAAAGHRVRGLPVRGDVAADLMDERGFPLLHGPDGLVAAHAVEWLRDGVPAGVLADVGRDVTPRLPASAHQVVGQRAEGANQVN